ncbi:MAG: amidohydrolase family protein [Bacteroidota bacterium]
MNKITADVIITNDGQPLTNTTITYSATGEILDISPDIFPDTRKLNGLLIPGYVNAHCHLELSHLRGVIPTGTGLIPFIKGVLQLRDFPEDKILRAIQAADQEMYDNGIVAVGDISNAVDTVATKEASKIRYHTFVEVFDLFQDFMLQRTLAEIQDIYASHVRDRGHKKSYVPHAPYSVSDELYEFINKANAEEQVSVSVHNQELDAENELFMTGRGEFQSFFRDIGMSLESFSPTKTTSIRHLLQRMDPSKNTLFVHNTTTSSSDISAAHAWSPNVYWVTCPNANLYIENRLPQYRHFIAQDARMCIGTDSLGSNWQLSVFEEMQTLKRYQSQVPDVDIIKWATLNGAMALGFDDLGRIGVGLTPGLNHIDVDVVDGVFDLSRARSSTRIV